MNWVGTRSTASVFWMREIPDAVERIPTLRGVRSDAVERVPTIRTFVPMAFFRAFRVFRGLNFKLMFHVLRRGRIISVAIFVQDFSVASVDHDFGFLVRVSFTFHSPAAVMLHYVLVLSHIKLRSQQRS